MANLNSTTRSFTAATKWLTALFLVILCASVTASAQTTGQKLRNRIAKIQKKGYMFGHQDDPFYGLTWKYEPGRSDTRDLTGDYPAIMGFDLGGIEMDDSKNLDSVPFRLIHDEAVKQAERHGIVTFSWHPRNPLTGGNAWDTSDSSVVRSILPGGAKHEKFESWMKRVANFLLTLKDKKGRRIPIVFRPWHENNGSWFWWGQKLCSDEEYKGLWEMLQDYLLERGLDNLVFCYSPNLDGNWTIERFVKRYPGDDRVDIIGEDAYQWGTEADYVKQINADLTFIEQFAKDHGRLMALTECGFKNNPDPTWWTRVLKPIMDRYDICWFLPWRNYSKEYFGPSKDEPSGKDFIKLYKASNTLFLKDIKKIK